MNPRPTSYAAKAGQGNQPTNVTKVQTEQINQVANTTILNSDPLIGEINVQIVVPTVEISQHIETLIIGDSIVRGLQDNLSDPKVKVLCMSGARIQNCSSYISEQRELPRVVVVHIGTNNLINAKTPNHVMRPLWLTIETAQKRFKNTIWIEHGILFRRNVPDWFVDDVNEAFDFMCDQLRLVYRDPNSAVSKRGLGEIWTSPQ